MNHLRLLHLSSLTNRDLVAGGVGYTVGCFVMAGVCLAQDRERVRMFNRSNTLTKRLLKESWVHLPPEVKDQFQDEIKFYNIAVQEDL